VDETGSVTVNNNLSVAGVGTITNSLTAGTITTNSGGVGQGAIRGKFVESVTGNTCANDQLLVYQTTGSPGWYCVASNNVGTSSVGTLLQVLQAGADAGTFANPVTIGVSSTTDGSDHGLTIVGKIAEYPILNLKDRDTNNTAGGILGVIQFGDSFNVYKQAKIQVIRGTTGSGGDYPTNMSFWTTPDGSTVAQERMTILHNGNIGIGTANSAEKLEIVGTPSQTVQNVVGIFNTNTSTEALNTGAAIIMGRASGSYYAKIATVFESQNPDYLRPALAFYTMDTSYLPGSEVERMRIRANGNVGIATTTPNEKFEVYDGTAGTARLRITDTGQNPELQLQYGATATDHWAFYNNQSDDSFRIWANGVDKMAIMQGGFVGIGTTTPTSKLTIVPNTGVEGVRIISSNYSPLIIKNTANNKDIFRIKENGELTLFVNGFSAMSLDTDLVLNVDNKVKTNIVKTELLTHYEDTGSNSTYYTYGDDGLEYCSSLEVYLDCQDTRLVQVIFDYVANFFSIPKALARPPKYYKARGVSDAPVCNTGDTQLYASDPLPSHYLNCEEGDDYTASYVHYRYCQTTTITSSEVIKIQFEGTPGDANPGLTKIKDNLVVEQNKWGDGVTSNCVWVEKGVPSTIFCPDGKFMAGYDTVVPRIYCCDL
jgi:hypothetical protein